MAYQRSLSSAYSDFQVPFFGEAPLFPIVLNEELDGSI